MDDLGEIIGVASGSGWVSDRHNAAAGTNGVVRLRIALKDQDADDPIGGGRIAVDVLDERHPEQVAIGGVGTRGPGDLGTGVGPIGVGEESGDG